MPGAERTASGHLITAPLQTRKPQEKDPHGWVPRPPCPGAGAAGAATYQGSEDGPDASLGKYRFAL